jgi:hypothetical protein
MGRKGGRGAWRPINRPAAAGRRFDGRSRREPCRRSCHTSTLLRPKRAASVALKFARKRRVKIISTVFHRKMTPMSGTQRHKNGSVGRRCASIRKALRWSVGASAILVSGQGYAFPCFSSANEVRQEKPGAWPSWTLRAPGHGGTKCWYATTRAAAHDHQTSVMAKAEHAGAKENFERDSEVTGLAPRADTAPAPSPVPGSSFDDRFSAMPSGMADSGSNLQRVIDLFRGVGGR